MTDVGVARRLLDDDEEVVLDLRPHGRRLVVPALVLTAVVGLASYAYFAVPDGSLHTPLQLAVGMVAAGVVARFAVWPWLSWLCTHYVVTTRRVVLREGVVRRSGRDVPLARVAEVSFRRSLRDRMSGCGTLTIESGGESGRVVLRAVPRVESVVREIHQLVRTSTSYGSFTA